MAMGARTIRSQTLGVSVGNPLSVMPALGVYNEQAFDTIDWSENHVTVDRQLCKLEPHLKPLAMSEMAILNHRFINLCDK